MKLFRLLPFMFLLYCRHTHAQVTTSIKAGMDASTMKFKYADAYPGRVGWYSGLAVHVPLKNQLFFQPELLYSLRGYHRNADSYSNASGNVGFGYVSLPLLIGYKPVKNLRLMAGPEPGYLLFARSHFNGNTSNITQYVNYRFSVDAAAGAAFAVTPRLAIEARVISGLTSLYRVVYVDAAGSITESTKSGRNRLIQLGASYSLK
jgi:hypothetical protein